MLLDTHPKGLIRTDVHDGQRFRRPRVGLGPLLVVVVVLLVSAMNAGLLTMVR